jgi:hypothetical protein
MKSVASLGVIALLAVSCTEAGIQPKDDNTNILVDNLLEVSGEVCASEPGERRFPVKIMFVVDTSGSMQFTDPSDKKPGCHANGLCGPLHDQCRAVCSRVRDSLRRSGKPWATRRGRSGDHAFSQ